MSESDEIRAKHLEELLQGVFGDLNITQDQRESLSLYLRVIKNKDVPTFLHSIRVGLLSVDIADYYNFDKRAFIYAGLLHDLGKCVIDSGLLKTKEPFTEEDRKKMEVHPEIGFNMLSGIHDFAANILVRHHLFQARPYPREIPSPRKTFAEEALEKVGPYARFIAIADFYDAITSREYINGLKEINTESDIKKVALEWKPADFLTIAHLIDKGVLNGRYK